MAKKARKKEATEGKPRGKGIGIYMTELLRAGKTTEEVLTAVHKKFPESKATGNDVSIIRRKAGLTRAA